MDHPVVVPLPVRLGIRGIRRNRQPAAVPRDKFKDLRRIREQGRPPGGFSSQHLAAVEVASATMRPPNRQLAHRILPAVEVPGHVDRHHAEIDPAVLRRVEDEDQLPVAVHVIGRLVRVKRRRRRAEVGKGKRLVARREQWQRFARPVGVELDDAGGGRAQPRADDALGRIARALARVFKGRNTFQQLPRHRKRALRAQLSR